ncbi:MAG: hypothetical protein ABIQ52_10525 [Vicinamibacterales bacterium]
MIQVAIIVAALMGPSTACLAGYPSVSTEFGWRSAVFLGTVISERREPATAIFDQPGITYLVRVDKVFKGYLGTTVELFSENTNAEFAMEADKKYLLFVYRDNGRRIVDNCGNSEVFSSESATLKQVRALAARVPK